MSVQLHIIHSVNSTMNNIVDEQWLHHYHSITISTVTYWSQLSNLISTQLSPHHPCRIFFLKTNQPTYLSIQNKIQPSIVLPYYCMPSLNLHPYLYLSLMSFSFIFRSLQTLYKRPQRTYFFIRLNGCGNWHRAMKLNGGYVFHWPK